MKVSEGVSCNDTAWLRYDAAVSILTIGWSGQDCYEATNSLHRSDIAQGAFLRRKKAQLGAPKAIAATAHKLARIIYSMLRYGQEYVDAGAEYYERRYQQRALPRCQASGTATGLSIGGHVRCSGTHHPRTPAAPIAV